MEVLGCPRRCLVRVHSSNNVPYQARNLEFGVVWERTYAEIAKSLSKPPKIAEHPTVERSELPGQLWCVPGSEHYSKSPLVLVLVPVPVELQEPGDVPVLVAVLFDKKHKLFVNQSRNWYRRPVIESCSSTRMIGARDTA
jgi:hypothetical protein